MKPRQRLWSNPGPLCCVALRLSTKRLADPFHALGPGVATVTAFARVDAGGVVDHVADQAR